MFEVIPYVSRRSLSYDPFRIFDDMERSFFGRSAPVSAFRTDVKDVGEAYMVEAELPGFKKEDISIEISNDILKMLLLDKLHNKNYRKIIVVCDDAELKKLTGKSLVAESIRQFNIEIKKFDLSDEVRNRIIEAQNRQVMVNK